jgi:hypothetical protein
MTAIASIDSECFIKILADEGFQVVASDTRRALLEKAGHGPALIIRRHTELNHTEILDWLDNAGIELPRFFDLRYKHCPP